MRACRIKLKFERPWRRNVAALVLIAGMYLSADPLQVGAGRGMGQGLCWPSKQMPGRVCVTCYLSCCRTWPTAQAEHT